MFSFLKILNFMFLLACFSAGYSYADIKPASEPKDVAELVDFVESMVWDKKGGSRQFSITKQELKETVRAIRKLGKIEHKSALYFLRHIALTPAPVPSSVLDTARTILRKKDSLYNVVMGSGVQNMHFAFFMIKSLEQGGMGDKEDAAKFFGETKAGYVVDTLIEALKDREKAAILLRQNIVWALGQIGGEKAESVLILTASDKTEHWVVRSLAIRALGRFKRSSEVGKALKSGLTDYEKAVQEAAREAIAVIEQK